MRSENSQMKAEVNLKAHIWINHNELIRRHQQLKWIQRLLCFKMPPKFALESLAWKKRWFFAPSAQWADVGTAARSTLKEMCSVGKEEAEPQQLVLPKLYMAVVACHQPNCDETPVTLGLMSLFSYILEKSNTFAVWFESVSIQQYHESCKPATSCLAEGKIAAGDEKGYFLTSVYLDP